MPAAAVIRRKANIDALLVDQMEPAGGAIADHLDCRSSPCAMRLPSIAIPRFRRRLRRGSIASGPAGYPAAQPNRLRARRPHNQTHYSRDCKVPSRLETSFACDARRLVFEIGANLPDAARTRLPAHDATAHFPLRRPAAQRVGNDPFPWDRLDGRRLVYASLGTLQNRRPELLRTIAAAFAGTDIRLVISHGGGLSDEQAEALPGSPIVVPYAPQRAVIARAALTITHAGLNTVLDSLAAGVPLITIPITYEQPAIARRVERTGAGASIPFAGLRQETLRELALKVLNSSEHRNAAQRMAASIAAARGASRAADIVLTVL